MTIAGHASLGLSAAEVGCHSVTFRQLKASSEEDLDCSLEDVGIPVFAAWEVALVHSVPFCTIRSPIQVLNRTDKVLQMSSGRLHTPGIRTNVKIFCTKPHAGG